MLAMALVGYEAEKKRIEERIRELRARISGRAASAAGAGAEPGQKRRRKKLSVAARKRISIAQKKRWAEHRKETGKE